MSNNHSQLIVQRMEKLFASLSDTRCDIKLITSGEKEMWVHSIIIRNASPFFDKMFSYDMKEKRENTVDLTKYSYESVYLLINYIYSGRVLVVDKDTNIGLLPDLLELTQLHEQTEYHTYLIDQMIKHITKSNIYSILELCYKYPAITERVKLICFELIKKTIEGNIQFRNLSYGINNCYDKNSTECYRYCCYHNVKYSYGSYSDSYCIKYYYEKKPVPQSAETQYCCLHSKKVITEIDKDINYAKISLLAPNIRDDIFKYLVDISV